MKLERLTSKILVAVVVVALVGVISFLSLNSTRSWKSYDAENVGVSFLYPKAWLINTTEKSVSLASGYDDPSIIYIVSFSNDFDSYLNAIDHKKESLEDYREELMDGNVIHSAKYHAGEVKRGFVFYEVDDGENVLIAYAEPTASKDRRIIHKIAETVRLK